MNRHLIPPLSRCRASSIRRSCRAGLLALIVVAGFSIKTFAGLSGAIFTTVQDGTKVNGNIFTVAGDVYLNGGPQNQNDPGLVPDGVYYFEVTTPSTAVLLSTDNAECRQVEVLNGRINGAHVVGSNCQHPNGTPNLATGTTPVKLAPFDTTTNPGGEYKVTLIKKDSPNTSVDQTDPKIIHYSESDAKSDNFKLKVSGECKISVDVPDLAICHADLAQGQLKATATGVSGGETYVWTYPDGTTDSTSGATITGLQFGLYVVAVTDGACTTFDSGTVSLGRDCPPIECTITCPPDATVKCGDSIAPEVLGEPAACSEGCAPVYSDTFAPGKCPGTIVVTRTWTCVNKLSGLTASCDQTIIIEDSGKPTIVCPADSTVYLDKDCNVDTTPAATGSATAKDNCEGCITVLLYNDTAQEGGFNDGATPTQGGGAPYTGFVKSFSTAAVSFATDFGYDWEPLGVDVPFGAYITGKINVGADGIYDLGLDSDDGSLLYIDGVLAVDNGGPHSPGANTAAISLTAGIHTFEIEFFECCGGPSGVDLILSEGVTYAPCVAIDHTDETVEGCGKSRVITRTWTATDQCGNSDSCEQTIKVLDNIAPVISQPESIRRCLDPFKPDYNVTIVPPAVTDNCEKIQAVGTRDDGKDLSDPYPLNKIVVITWTAVDDCGNQATPVYQRVLIEVCTCPGSGGLTLGFWSNKNGKKTLQPNDDAWRKCLNDLNLKNGNGSSFTLPLLPTKSFDAAHTALNNWLLSANANNMANMLSAQLTATKLDTLYNGLNGGAILFIPSGLTIGGANAVQKLAGTPGFTTDILGNGYISIDNLIKAAKTDLGLAGHNLTVSSGAIRTYQDVLKTLLDKVNNNQLRFVASSPCAN